MYTQALIHLFVLVTTGRKGYHGDSPGCVTKSSAKESCYSLLSKKNTLISTPKVRPGILLKTFKNLYAQQLVT